MSKEMSRSTLFQPVGVRKEVESFCTERRGEEAVIWVVLESGRAIEAVVAAVALGAVMRAKAVVVLREPRL